MPACLSAERSSISFRFKFGQILALKINRGNILERGISPLFQDHSKVGNSWYVIIAGGKKNYMDFILLCDWHLF